jgi:hypothetical protein
VKHDGIFVTFMNRQHPNNRIGYRIFEHTPIVFGEAPQSIREAGIDLPQLAKLEKAFSERPEVMTVEHRITKEHWIRQDWTFYLAPAHDGIDVLLVVDTFDEGLPSYYGIQQCFRMSGHTNALWRQKIAKTICGRRRKTNFIKPVSPGSGATASGRRFRQSARLWARVHHWVYSSTTNERGESQ